LSAGQFQRALFARMMLQDAPLILLDEPFNAIDARTTRDLLALVHRWHGESRTIIAVLHDMEMVREHFPDSVMVARECLGWGPTGEVVTPSNLLRARQMSEAWDDEADRCLRRAG
jgi:zinc/manganese transport system ATP-binding protein